MDMIPTIHGSNGITSDDGKSSTILLIDDDPEILEALEEMRRPAVHRPIGYGAAQGDKLAFALKTAFVNSLCQPLL